MSIVPTYKGEVMLLRWGDSATNGQTATFALDDGPDGNEINPFKGFQVGKGGQRFMLVAVAIGDDEEPNTAVGEAEAKPKKHFRDLKLAQQAGIKCGEVDFQEWTLKQARALGWLGRDHGAVSEDYATAYVRKFCNVNSRADLDTDEAAARKWKDLVFQFIHRDDPQVAA